MITEHWTKEIFLKWNALKYVNITVDHAPQNNWKLKKNKSQTGKASSESGNHNTQQHYI